jgi:hypothetical protein
VLGCTLGISANMDLICQAKGIQPPIPLKQTNKQKKTILRTLANMASSASQFSQWEGAGAIQNDKWQ